MTKFNNIFAIIAGFLICVIPDAYGITADYGYFGLQEPNREERDLVYADLMYSGLREANFYEFAKKYVNQDLTESGLVNIGILV